MNIWRAKELSIEVTAIAKKMEVAFDSLQANRMATMALNGFNRQMKHLGKQLFEISEELRQGKTSE